MVENEEVSKPRRRGSRGVRGSPAPAEAGSPAGGIVKSRYLQYDKKNAKKVLGRLAAGLGGRSAKGRNGLRGGSDSRFGKGNLQSTLLNGDKINRPEFDLSAINGKHLIILNFFIFFYFLKREESDVLQVLESQTLLLTYLRIKVRKNLAEVEEKGEKDLITLCEEKERQREKLFKLKREILLNEREQKLDEALDKQMEVLCSLVPVCERFKEQYKSFAVSLDATRHELPIKNIHIEGDTPTFLDELQKQLTTTQELLTEVTPSYSEESQKLLSSRVTDLTCFICSRSFTQVQNMAYEASKEVSLHNQRIFSALALFIEVISLVLVIFCCFGFDLELTVFSLL
uniref:HAUS augmin like complex subunit 8 n=1 Tax=Calidris pygmaea TaxID=425635 RepID=A0A8C3JVG1_9CHAR